MDAAPPTGALLASPRELLCTPLVGTKLVSTLNTLCTACTWRACGASVGEQALR